MRGWTRGGGQEGDSAGGREDFRGAQVMQRAIDAGGSTMATYVRADGTKGSYLEEFAQVFQREGRRVFVVVRKLKK